MSKVKEFLSNPFVIPILGALFVVAGYFYWSRIAGMQPNPFIDMYTKTTTEVFNWWSNIRGDRQ